MAKKKEVIQLTAGAAFTEIALGRNVIDRHGNEWCQGFRGDDMPHDFSVLECSATTMRFREFLDAGPFRPAVRTAEYFPVEELPADMNALSGYMTFLAIYNHFEQKFFELEKKLNGK